MKKLSNLTSLSVISNDFYSEVKEFYFGSLMKSFPERAEAELSNNFSKHLSEINVILQMTREDKTDHKISFLDIGGGLGINAMILSQLFDYDCSVIDRYTEFSPEHKRVVGDKFGVTKRLEQFNVNVCERNFIEEGFPYLPGTFDIISNFDVIEHFNFSPRKFISDISSLLKPSGFFVLGTPNQAHLYNRVKAALGKNTWEDFEYYYSADHFFGHIREYVPSELELIIRREPTLDFVEIVYSNYPFEDRREWLKGRIGYLPALVLRTLVNSVVYMFPKLNYYMIAIAKKK